MNAQLQRELVELRKLKIKALKARYRELFGEESPSSNYIHLFRRIAWRLQALSEGELSQRARDRAETLAADVDLRLRAPKKFWREFADSSRSQISAGAQRDPRLPPAGTTLERQYGDQTIRVTVLDDGFECQGKRYDSLSAIASSVSGTRWNGFAFFRLRKQAQHG